MKEIEIIRKNILTVVLFLVVIAGPNINALAAVETKPSIKLDARERKIPLSDATTSWGYYGVTPESPDEKRLCYALYPEPIDLTRDVKYPVNPAELWVCNIDGTGHRRLFRGNSPVHNGLMQSWVDNERIVFASDGDIYIINADTGKIDFGPFEGFSPGHYALDGKVLMYQKENFTKPRGIYEFDTATGKMRLAVPYNDKIWHVQCSTDGKTILFRSKDDNYNTLGVADLESGDVKIFPGEKPMHFQWFDKQSFFGYIVPNVMGGDPNTHLMHEMYRWNLDGKIIEHLAGYGCHGAARGDGKYFAGESWYGSDPIVLRLYGRRSRDSLHTIFSHNFVLPTWRSGRHHVNPSFSRDGMRLYYKKAVNENTSYAFSYDLTGLVEPISQVDPRQVEQDRFDRALVNGKLANEGFRRCHNYVEGWLKLADSETGLIPKNRKTRYWNAKDSAADNYPFMVLTTSFTDRSMFEGRMKEMLRTEIELTSRIGALPDTYDFDKKGFLDNEPDLNSILFGSSEYIKDGLLPLTEWLGASPWCDRMLSILDDMWKRAPVETPYGKIVSTNVELNGEMLQALSRIYWMTGDRKYLEWAIRLGDYYLLDKHHPTRDTENLRLRDHGCEIVSGLCELYAAVHFAMPEKKKAYSKPIHEMLDRILEVGRNPDGLFYNAINPIAGTHKDKGIADTWGYTYNGIYTVYLIDGTKEYRDATIKVLSNINSYRNYKWERDSSDGYADSIESALNLYNRERVESAGQWIDSEIKVMWKKQQPDGVIEGWHGDGNFARTSIMYCLWKTQGVSVHPWREDIVVGAVREGDELYLCITAQKDWQGKVHFDSPRHRTIMKLPIDWPRINQFPEWFTVDPEKRYVLRDTSNNEQPTYTGKQLHDGIEMSLKAGDRKKIRLIRLPVSDRRREEI